MADAFLEFNDVYVEDMGVLAQGSVKLSDSSVAFKNESTGKVTTAPSSELHGVEWSRLANMPGLRLIFEAPEDNKTTQRPNMRIGGFKEEDQGRITKFIEKNWEKTVKERELGIKGWNYGDTKIRGPNLEFHVDTKLAFEIPLHNVSKCVAAKNEATLEFQENDDANVALTEMRFFMAEEDAGEDRVEAFRQMVLKYAGIETEQAGQAVATLEQILCMTPRGRYDIKVYPNHLSLHGKTYDYKIPVKSITRLFLVPHKDGRHMYFVISLNPPIRQGQTRYHYLVIEFIKDEHVDLELGMTQEQLNELYDKKLDREQSGNQYEIVSRIFRALVNMRITVPGNFVGHSGTPAIACAHKQASGFLYPLEKGLLYIHKPPMYVRFEEVSSVHFARSDVSTRSFDFEIELKSGSSLVFNSVEKEEYNKLFDFVSNKGLRIRNAKKMEKSYAEDRFAGSDDEHDAYKETVKAEGKEKMGGSDDDDSDEEDSDYDLDKDLEKRRQLKKQEADPEDQFSGSEPDEEWDSNPDSDSGSGSGSGSGSEEEEEERPKKKPKKEKKRKDKDDDDGEKKKGKRAKKDPNAPKRGLTAYLIWFNQARASIKKEGDSIGDVSKKGGAIWNKMSADEKKVWEKKAEEDKERYEREMEEYKKNGGANGSSGGKSSGTPKKKTGSPQKAAKSKEFVESSSGSEDDSDDKPLKPSKEKKKSKKKEESDKSASGSGSGSD